jgi:hypothetical protein
VKAAIGYAFPLDINETATFKSLYADIVPYVSFDQSLTDTERKPRVLGPSNNVAVGILNTAFVHFQGQAPVNHAFTIKPQYLWNTKDGSEIASLKAIWAPWTFYLSESGAPVLNVNSAFRIASLPGGIYARLLFDLRSDVGYYAAKGDDPVAAASRRSFERAGTKFGIALSSTEKGFPPLTLLVTETLMYGFSGERRNLNLFDSTLLYTFDSNGYFSAKASYQTGRDEDTAARIQGWTFGLSARY